MNGREAKNQKSVNAGRGDVNNLYNMCMRFAPDPNLLLRLRCERIAEPEHRCICTLCCMHEQGQRCKPPPRSRQAPPIAPIRAIQVFCSGSQAGMGAPTRRTISTSIIG